MFAPMETVSRTFRADQAELARILAPRDDLLLEKAEGNGVFGLAEGPFRHYRRVVRVEGAPTASDPAEPMDGGDPVVSETVEFELETPGWAWLFRAPTRAALLRRPAQGERPPWWAPPHRLDSTQSRVLALVCQLSVIAGYLGALLTMTITYAAEEFGASDRQQGVALATVRAGVLLSLAAVWAADRFGRRRVVLATATACVLVTALGSVSQDLTQLTATQVVARGLSTALFVLLGVYVVEEMPAGARAYAVSVSTMAAALGAGATVIFATPIADSAQAAWRIFFAAALVFLLPLRPIARILPETRRFERSVEQPHPSSELSPEEHSRHRRRFALMAVSAFLGGVFAAPASQFLNEFLRDERSFSGARIALFRVLTGLPGGIGIVVGGRLADTRGRRPVGAVAMVVGTLMAAAGFLTDGWVLWVTATVGSIVGAAAIPTLGVYGPELFPTNLRGAANGGIAVAGVIGSAIGLLTAGALSEAWGALGPGIAVLAAGPLLLALLIVVFYPETADLELEEINPEDARPEPESTDRP
ncbi:MAG: hypothetical protein KatS3mg008_0828 [Acidimicrobiales bacterium]|nr:MAG: hypothetical protein KatS3mg008_0828 [Acidimicrobiales bacterium]